MFNYALTKAAINAAEEIQASLSYDYNSTKNNIESYKEHLRECSENEREYWQSAIDEEKVKLDIYESVFTALQKAVKSAI